ncbi:sialyltransferase [Chloropicon primus]|uniref:Sialyltransferase n=2 Tax=Chloropicon primus TaxID=1764295 RepID=A0A5B8MJQ4_9CHLO|nr:sialyltransferase [Chloropicon primus]|eukprot:QDZ19620.1 sialyltransferase [Chloropicon primus]
MKRRRPKRLIWFPVLLGFCILTVIVARGNFLGLQKLESELSHVDSRPESSVIPEAKAEEPKAEEVKEERPLIGKEFEQTVKSQFSEVFSGSSANSSSLDKFSERLFHREVRRMETELKNEMQRETWKLKQKDGKIKKLKVQRIFEADELEYYKERRSKDAKRVLKVFSSSAFGCMDTEGCKKAMEFQIKMDLSFDADAFAVPYEEPCIVQENGTEVATMENCDQSKNAFAPHDMCSVVGNSGVMKRSNKGVVINKSSAVFRINQAPTSGHVGDVGMPFSGEKRTYRVLNNAWAQIYAGIFHNHRHYEFKRLPLEKNCTLMLTRSQPHTYLALVENLRKNGREDVKVYQISQSMMQRAREVMINYRMLSDRIAEMEHRWKQNQVKGGTTPSTGFVGILLAKRLCSQVNVFGLSKEASRDKSSSTWSYHYFQHSHKNIDLPAAELRAHPHHSFRLEGEKKSDHTFGCPVVRKPDSDCGGGGEKQRDDAEAAVKEEPAKVSVSSEKSEIGEEQVVDSGSSKRGLASGDSSGRQRSSKRAPSSRRTEEPRGSDGANATTTETRRGRSNNGKRRVRQSTQVITKRNHDRAKAAVPRGATQSKELQELEEILRAQEEQNEKAKKAKKPAQNLKHTPLDKIKDPEVRKREEAWRAEEAKMSGAQIDANCLAKGSSDPCFQRWMKGVTRVEKQ